MKIYDSSNLHVVAVAVGAVLTLTTQAQGTPVPDKTVSQSGGHMTISNPTLETGGKRLTGMTSVVTLAGVVNTDSLTIGGKTYVAGVDFTVGGSDSVTATNLAAAINTPVMAAQPAWLFNHENLNIDGKVSGTGAVSVSLLIEHSHNGTDWATLATLAPSGTGSAVATSAQSKAKPFLRVTPSSLTGTGAKAEVWVTGAPVNA